MGKNLQSRQTHHMNIKQVNMKQVRLAAGGVQDMAGGRCGRDGRLGTISRGREGVRRNGREDDAVETGDGNSLRFCLERQSENRKPEMIDMSRGREDGGKNRQEEEVVKTGSEGRRAGDDERKARGRERERERKTQIETGRHVKLEAEE